MPDEKAGLDVPIRVRLEADDSAKAAAGLRKLGGAAEDTTKTLRTMRDVGRELKSALGELVAVAELVKQFREGSEQVANMEQVMNGLRLAVEKNGDEFEKVRGQIEGYSKKLTEAAGIDDDVAVPAMIKLYQVTGDVAKSIDLMRIAADLSVGANIDLASAADIVGRSATGSTRELKQLNITIEESLPRKEKARIALELLEKRYGGAAAGARGLRVDQGRLTEAWEDFRNRAVEPLAMALIQVGKVGMTALKVLELGIRDLVNAGVLLANGFAGVGRVLWASLTGDFAKAKGELTALMHGLKSDWQVFKGDTDKVADEVVALWMTAGGKVDLGVRATKDLFIAGEGEKRQAVEDTMIAHVQAWERYLEKVQQLNDRELEMYRANQLKMRKLGTDFLQKSIEARETAEAAERRMSEKTKDDAKRIIREKQSKEEQARDDKLRGEEALASGILGIAGSLFGDTKEFAIAEAIINTYLGASKALSQGGIYGPALAAIVIAAGLLQVATIASTRPRGGAGAAAGGGGQGIPGRSNATYGFDDPGNDAAARIGGYRWAQDMIREFNAGASAGWERGMMRGGGGNTSSTSTTYDDSRHWDVQIAIPGVVDPTTTSDLKRLGRHLAQVDKQIDGARVISRRRSR